jgi:hypothetical protein
MIKYFDLFFSVAFKFVLGTGRTTGYDASATLSENGSHVFDITKPQLEFLVSCNFTIEKMSVLLNVSTKTIQRRLRLFNYFNNFAYYTLILITSCIITNYTTLFCV